MMSRLMDVARGLSALTKKGARAYCRLVDVHDDAALAADDGSLVSLVAVDGSLRIVDAAQMRDMRDRLLPELSWYFEVSGHSLQVVFDYDPELSSQVADGMVTPQMRTGQVLGFAADRFMPGWANALSQYVSEESVILACWTHPHVQPPPEQAAARHSRFAKMREAPQGRDAIASNAGLAALGDRHHAFVGSLLTSMSGAGIVARRLAAEQSLIAIRRMADPVFTDNEWRPCIPGVRTPPQQMSESESRPHGPFPDCSDVWYPDLRDQLLPREAEELDVRTLSLGDRWYRPLAMELGPSDPAPFSRLFDRLRAARIPWRVSFLLQGDGLGGLTYRKALAMLFMQLSPSSRQLYRSIKGLESLREGGDTIVRFQAMFLTWSAKDDEPALNRRAALLASAVQSWGGCEVAETIGAPMEGFAACMPGWIPRSPANPAAAPLHDVLFMLPLARPAQIWKSGSMPFRTVDGRAMPYLQGSSQQASWIDIGIAPMSGGKSTLLNAQTVMFCMLPGISAIPLLSNIDIGPSSRGAIELLRSVLPADQRHLVIYHRLRMTTDHSVNPFDTPLGCRRPLPAHYNYLVNLVSLFATGLGRGDVPAEGVAGIARKSIDAAYDRLSPEQSPRRYQRNVDRLVDAAVDEGAHHYDEHTSWWDIVDALFDAGHIHEATLAQRFAVPLLAEVGAQARTDAIASIYPENVVDGLPLPDFFWRKCVEAVEAYPILREPTRLDLGEARVISLDLDEVAPRGTPVADRQTAVMFMIARHIVASRFFVMPADVELMPERYRPFHKERIERIRRLPKRWNMDEFHRGANNPVVADQILADIDIAARESRKWNLHIGLYSQGVVEFPPTLLDLATSFYLLGVGSERLATEIQSLIGLSDAARDALIGIRKPDQAGAYMVAVHKTTAGKVEQLIANTLSPALIWAFSTTTEDADVRAGLAARIGFFEACTLLARHYPGGCKSVVERRREEKAAQGATGEVLDEIVEEMHAAYREFVHRVAV